MEYGDENVQAVLFIAIDFQTSAASLRFLENGIRYLQSNFENCATSDGKICDGDHDRGNSVQDIRSEKKLPL